MKQYYDKLSESEMFVRLRSGEVRVPPLDLKWTDGENPLGPDATLRASWEGAKYRFVAEIKGRSTPKVFTQAIAQAQDYAERLGGQPLVVVPYLSPERLQELERIGVSGIDLSGNAFVVVPGKLLVLRTGAPNKFRESYAIREVYRGNTSLVARALLLRPRTESLADLRQFIRQRGGSITLTTISKALRRLEDDVLVERRGGRARLLQPEALLDKLAGAYRPPKVRRCLVGSNSLDRAGLAARLANTPARMVLTGQSSTDRYAVMGREARVRFYTDSIAPLVGTLGSAFTEGERFANLELLETNDPTVYFDVRRSGDFPCASPIQAYLELVSGDKREQETAAQIRSLILDELRQKMDA
jgi:DNA-binding HxlR family transcriptional regulator